MKHKYFTNFIDDLDVIYKNHLEKYDDAFEKVVSAREQKAKADADNTSQWRKEKKRIAENELRVAERTFQREAQNIQESCGRDISELRKQLQHDISEFVAADPKRVDANAITLLNSGILTTFDLARLANSNWNNGTMLRLISNYCANRNFDNHSGDRAANLMLKKAIDDYCAGTAQLDTFDAAALWVKKCLQPNEFVAGSMQKEYPSAISELREHMATTDSFRVEV